MMIEEGTTVGTRNDEDTGTHLERINVWDIYTVPAFIPGIGVQYAFISGPVLESAATPAVRRPKRRK